MRQSTGVRRLDELLKGGLPDGCFTLLYGPPFLGKDVLANLFVLTGMRQGVPAVALLSDMSSGDVRGRLRKNEPAFAEMDGKGLLQVVDAYSRGIGHSEGEPHTEYVDGPMNLNGLSVAVNNAEAKLVGQYPQHRLVFDSLSTLMTYTNPQTVFRFLQVLVGRTKKAGATGLLMLTEGMHSDAEVQTLKHLCDGVVHVRSENRKNMIHVEGLGLTEAPGWVEYRFEEALFEITGSFAAGRIR